MSSKEVVILSAVRTAVGSFGGSLASVPAVKLGEVVVKEAIKRAQVTAEQIDELMFGCVLQAGLGQNVARQVSIGAGIPESTPSFTVNKVCGSGLKTITMAAQAIKAGDADIIVAGGTENMSMAPYAVPKARWGARMGPTELLDVMIQDGLWDAFNNYHMGITAENIAEKYGFTREDQDRFAYTSQERAAAAIKANRFQDEIVAVEIPQRKKDPILFTVDEHPRLTSMEKMAGLRPAFKPDGTVTAGNASGINDGAGACVIASLEIAEKLGLTPMAKIKSYASAGVDPKYMGLGPIPSSKKALEKASLTIRDMDLVEANEAFAAQSLAVVKELELDLDKTNVNGGAIALGHPIGASGTRIFTTLLHEMKKRESQYGLATLCIGGGQGTAVIVENMS